jgi:hypothetical protein
MMFSVAMQQQLQQWQRTCRVVGCLEDNVGTLVMQQQVGRHLPVVVCLAVMLVT